MRCRHCIRPIEPVLADGDVAWHDARVGTRRCYGVLGSLGSHEPDLSIEAIEEWLNA